MCKSAVLAHHDYDLAWVEGRVPQVITAMQPYDCECDHAFILQF